MSLVHVKNKKNDITYIFESTSYWDKEKQQTRNTRKCIGKLDSLTGNFVPSKKGVYSAVSLPTKPKPVPSLESKRSFCGATYLFDAIGKKLGVTKDLKACFPETYKQNLSMVYYLVIEDRNPLSRFPKCTITHHHPFSFNIPSQRNSKFQREVFHFLNIINS